MSVDLFSFLLLSFAALLCLSGFAMAVDGIIRIAAEWYKHANRTPADNQEQEEKSTRRERAA
jgi:hypothetical protein